MCPFCGSDTLVMLDGEEGEIDGGQVELKLADNPMKRIQTMLLGALLCLLGTAGYANPLKYLVEGNTLTNNQTKTAFVATTIRK